MPDGAELILCYSCRDTRGWLSEEEFGIIGPAQRSAGNRKSQCKKCGRVTSARNDSKRPELKKRRMEEFRAKRTPATLAKADTDYAAWLAMPSEPVPYWMIVDYVRLWLHQILLVHEEKSNVAQVLGLHIRKLHRIESGNAGRGKPVITVDISDLERIAEEADQYDKLTQLLPDWYREPGLDGWDKARGNRHCIVCGSWFHPHQAGGRCARCYWRWYQNDFVDPPNVWINKMWAPKLRLSACVVCNQATRRHVARGECTKCYHNGRRARNEAAARARD